MPIIAYIKDNSEQESALRYVGNEQFSLRLSICESILRNAMKNITL